MPRGFKGFMDRSTSLLTTMNTRHQIAKELEGLRSRVMEVNERRLRYKVDETVSKPNNTVVDSRVLALHAQSASLVGIEEPRDQLIKLMDEESVPASHQLKVLSIVGFGGLGKTTLANEIYRKQEGLFLCQAFVSVSQKPNIRKVLRTILSQVGFKPPMNTNMEMWEESELIRTLQNFLLDKRYASNENKC
jgi:ABC-type glutathione transport system ATPase component